MKQKSLAGNSAKKRKILIGCAVGGVAVLMMGVGVGTGYLIGHKKIDSTKAINYNVNHSAVGVGEKIIITAISNFQTNNNYYWVVPKQQEGWTYDYEGDNDHTLIITNNKDDTEDTILPSNSFAIENNGITKTIDNTIVLYGIETTSYTFDTATEIEKTEGTHLWTEAIDVTFDKTINNLDANCFTLNGYYSLDNGIHITPLITSVDLIADSTTYRLALDLNGLSGVSYIDTITITKRHCNFNPNQQQVYIKDGSTGK